PLPENPNLKNYTTLDGLKTIVSDWGRAGPDGLFAVVGIPGPGFLVAAARPADRYALLDAKKELAKTGTQSWPAGPVHAIVRINPSEADPSSLTCAIGVEPGYTLSGTVVGPDGRPLTGVKIAGLKLDDSPQTLEQASFSVPGLKLDGKRILVSYHREKKLGS